MPFHVRVRKRKGRRSGPPTYMPWRCWTWARSSSGREKEAPQEGHDGAGACCGFGAMCAAPCCLNSPSEENFIPHVEHTSFLPNRDMGESRPRKEMRSPFDGRTRIPTLRRGPPRWSEP